MVQCATRVVNRFNFNCRQCTAHGRTCDVAHILTLLDSRVNSLSPHGHVAILVLERALVRQACDLDMRNTLEKARTALMNELVLNSDVTVDAHLKKGLTEAVAIIAQNAKDR